MVPGQQPPTTLSFSAPPTLQPFFLNAFHKGSPKTGAPGTAGQPSVPKKVPPSPSQWPLPQRWGFQPLSRGEQPPEQLWQQGLGVAPLQAGRRAGDRLSREADVGWITHKPPGRTRTFRMGSWVLIHLAKLSHQHRFLQRLGLPLESSGTSRCSGAPRPPLGCEVCCLSGLIVSPKPALQGERWGKREVPAPSRARRRLNKAREMPSLSLKSSRSSPTWTDEALPSQEQPGGGLWRGCFGIKNTSQSFPADREGKSASRPRRQRAGHRVHGRSRAAGSSTAQTSPREGGDGLSKQP